MANRDDDYPHLHYTTVLPSNNVQANPGEYSPDDRKPTALERAKALYVDFEDAFQDETTNHDYFGLQPLNRNPKENDDKTSDKPANFYLQSVETITELKGGNYSPSIRYQASREGSRPSTPSDITPPYAPRINSKSKSSEISRHRNSNDSTTDSSGITNIHNDFRKTNLSENKQNDDEPPPFTPEAIQIKFDEQQMNDDSLMVSTHFKLVLPQYFLVKYLGRTQCPKVWGSQTVRQPIDDMVQNARQLSSINEVPTLEACVNVKGLSLVHRNPVSRNKEKTRRPSPERSQNGLIPLEFISYVMHDVKYSKIAACIILRHSKTSSNSTEVSKKSDMISECYGFLFQSKDHANRFALSLAEAFSAKRRSKSKGNSDRREEHSPARRPRHRHGFQHEKIRVDQYDDSYLRDSEV